MKFHSLTTLIASTLFLNTIALPSEAVIFSYGIRKISSQTQTSNAIPTSTSFSFLSQLAGDSPSEFSNVTTTYNGALSPLSYDINDLGANFRVASTDFINYTTQSALDADFPDGSVYTFEISGGTLGTQTALLNSPATSLLQPIPYLSGDTFSQLQGLDPSQPFTLTWDGFSAPTNSTNSFSLISLLISPSSGAPVINQSFSPSTTSFVIPANTLVSDTNYRFSLAYTTDVTTNTGFGSARGFSFFQQITDGNFNTFSNGGNTPGESQNNPILPNRVTPDGTFVFENVISGQWVDPPLASGYTYNITSPGSLFTSILNFPTGFANPFTVTANGSILGSFSNGQSVDFVSLLGAGVESFEISNIFPFTDATDTQAFPLQIAFNTPTASFTQTPIQPTQVPEPSTLLGIATSLGLGSFFKRKQAKKDLD